MPRANLHVYSREARPVGIGIQWVVCPPQIKRTIIKQRSDEMTMWRRSVRRLAFGVLAALCSVFRHPTISHGDPSESVSHPERNSGDAQIAVQDTKITSLEGSAVAHPHADG